MATVSFSTIFNLQLSTKQFQFTDTTDYEGQGLGTNDMFGAFQITAPSGSIVYDKGTPSTGNFNIRNATSRDSVGTIALTLNTDGTVEQGLYSILYTVWDVSGFYYSVTETFNFIYASPTVQINGTVAVYTPSPLITLQDETVYIVNSITPTIDRTATISYEPMVIDNVLSTPTPTVGVTATTTSNYFFSPTTELLSVITNLSYAYASNFTVLDTVSGSQSLFVDATSYCSTVCGLNEMAVRREANPNNSQLANDFALAMSYWTLIMANQTCSNPDLINGYLTQIQAIGSFNSDCTCCDGQFQQVVGLGGLVSAYDIISANSYIGVTSSESGGTKTYVLTLSQTFVDLVTAQGSDISTLQTQMTTVQGQITTVQGQITGLLLLGTNAQTQTSLTLATSEAQITALNITTTVSGTYLVLCDVSGDVEDNACTAYLHITKNGTYTETGNNLGFVAVSTTTDPASTSWSNIVSITAGDVIGIKAYATDAFGYTCTITLKAIKIV